MNGKMTKQKKTIERKKERKKERKREREKERKKGGGGEKEENAL
jgi:hypothetical protein